MLFMIQEVLSRRDIYNKKLATNNTWRQTTCSSTTNNSSQLVSILFLWGFFLYYELSAYILHYSPSLQAINFLLFQLKIFNNSMTSSCRKHFNPQIRRSFTLLKDILFILNHITHKQFKIPKIYREGYHWFLVKGYISCKVLVAAK